MPSSDVTWRCSDASLCVVDLQFVTVKIKCIGVIWKLSMYTEVDLIMTQFHIPASLRK